ncbi:hypothetical protein ACOT81_00450 [Streptomyces sp. WI04-05B]
MGGGGGAGIDPHTLRQPHRVFAGIMYHDYGPRCTYPPEASTASG